VSDRLQLKNTSNVIVTGVGGIIGEGIIKCLRMANRSKKRNSRHKYYIIGVDSSPLAAGLYFSDIGMIIPNANDQDYVDSLIAAIEEHSVSAVYIGTDQELDVVSNLTGKIEKRTGAKILICSKEVIKISRDKWKTYQFLKRKKLPYVESSLPDGSPDLVERFGFPLVVKPREGYGSVQFNIVHDRNELDNSVKNIESQGWNPIIQQYIEGNDNEYTTGVLTDCRNNNIISSISIKKFLKSGQTYKGIIDDFPEARRVSETVATNLIAKGAINVQSKISDGSHKIFEINGRISATCPMRAAAGINEPDLLYRNVILSEDLEMTSYEKLVSMRYWNEVYVQKRISETVASTGIVPHGIRGKVFSLRAS
jgi:carbamoyl-phosphate synthase large subunit